MDHLLDKITYVTDAENELSIIFSVHNLIHNNPLNKQKLSCITSVGSQPAWLKHSLNQESEGVVKLQAGWNYL